MIYYFASEELIRFVSYYCEVSRYAHFCLEYFYRVICALSDFFSIPVVIKSFLKRMFDEEIIDTILIKKQPGINIITITSIMTPPPHVLLCPQHYIAIEIYYILYIYINRPNYVGLLHPALCCTPPPAHHHHPLQ